MPHFAPSPDLPRRLRRWVASALVGATAITGALTSIAPAGPVQAGGIGDHDWLAIVNAYRVQSGLPAVTENPTWSAGARNHSCWMLLNGIAHDEPAGTPGYTVSGDEAGNSGNVAVTSDPSATPRDHIDLWMSGPFHAVGVLRPSLAQVGFGLCSSPPNPSTTNWRSGGTLDIIRGNIWGAPPKTQAVVFPGNGATTNLTRFIAESPDPRTFCGWNGRSVGLPLLALMPGPVTSANAWLSGPNGPIDVCVLHAGNTSGVAKSILGGDNAVIILPSAPLQTGSHSVALTSTGGSVNWSFNVDPDAPLLPSNEPPPANTTVIGSSGAFQPMTPFRFADSRENLRVSRLQARVQKRVRIAGVAGIPADATAISANFTVVNPSGDGFFTAFNCSGSAPEVSTLNYRAGRTRPNQALVPLGNGDLCLYANRNVDVVIDVNGYVSPGGQAEFVPVTPKRLLDTRSAVPVAPGNSLRVTVAGGNSPAPLRADAVALNVTAVSPLGNGWLRAYPCDRAEPEVSSLNPRYLVNRPNSAIVPVAADGSICLSASVTTHVVIDITGWFGPDDTYEFMPLAPIRLADTRSYQAALNARENGRKLAAGQVLTVKVAGTRGIPADAKAATLNLVAVDSEGAGWLKVVPCGTSSNVSNLNYTNPSAIANGANVKLAANGTVCVTANRTTHVLVDITGVWS